MKITLTETDKMQQRDTSDYRETIHTWNVGGEQPMKERMITVCTALEKDKDLQNLAKHCLSGNDTGSGVAG